LAEKPLQGIPGGAFSLAPAPKRKPLLLMKQGPLTQTNKHKNYFLSTAKIMKSPDITNHTSKKRGDRLARHFDACAKGLSQTLY
jgi:hypothetical protein